MGAAAVAVKAVVDKKVRRVNLTILRKAAVGYKKAAATAHPWKLEYRAPYDWDAFLGFVGPRAIPGIECVEGVAYKRAGMVVTHSVAGKCLQVVAGGERDLGAVMGRAAIFFDVDANPREIGRHLSKSAVLKKMVARHPGLRVPGAWDGFELAVRAMLGQQVTVKGATTLAGRLVARFGAPKPEILADAELTVIGIPKARAESIRAFARAVADGYIRLDGPLDGARSSAETIERMCELPGIGPWTANYIAMRALGDGDAFPASDLGLLKAAGIVPARRLMEMAEAWRPWRAYAAMHLWESLRERN